jgi:hypothetical protein
MFCKQCGAPVGDTDMVCSQCGAMTEYGEQVSRHNAMPPQTPSNAINPDGTLNANYRAQTTEQTDTFFGQNTENAAKNGGYYYAPQNATATTTQKPQEKMTNGMAIAGFILAFFEPILGLIFSIIALKKSKSRNGVGGTLAKAGIIISIPMFFVWIFINITLLSMYIEELGDIYGMVGALIG